MGRIHRSALPWIALVALLLVAGAFLYHESRGTALWYDDWTWALHRRADNLDTFLKPHNQHLSLVPIAIYKLLFATAGLGEYAPYRAVGIAAHLIVVALLFAYASRRVGGLLALIACSLILFLGPAWQNLIWPFQIGWLISIAAGLGALLVLDRADRRGDVAACVLLALSLASSGLGVAIALGLAVDVVWGRRRRRDAWIVAAPLALYGLWWLSYQDARFVRHDIVVMPSFVAEAAAGAMSALVGLGGQAVSPSAGDILPWGAPLALGAVASVSWRLARLGRLPPRVLALLTTLLSFWVLTALSRAFISRPYESRYLYVGGIFVVMLAVELARGIRPSRRVCLLIGVAAAAAVVSNIGALRDGARFLRGQAQLTTTELGALDLARPIVKPNFISDGFPFGILAAGPYFAAERSLGSPAATPAQIAGKPEDLRKAADAQLIRIHRIGLREAPPALRLATRPVVDDVAGGRAIARGACVRFRPAGFTEPGMTPQLQVTVPPAGVLLRTEGGPATVSVRRFADGFPSQPQGRLAASAAAILRIRPDLAARPWHLRVAPVERATVCGLR